MAKIEGPRYLVHIKKRYYHWMPGPSLRRSGWKSIGLGQDRIQAEVYAEALNDMADRKAPPIANLDDLKAWMAGRSAGATVVAAAPPPTGPSVPLRHERKPAHREPSSEPPAGTVDFLFWSYLRSERVRRLAAESQKDYAKRLWRLADHPINARRFGECTVAAVEPISADRVFAELEAMGPTQAHAIMRYARAAWTWGRRAKLAPADNPWEKMGVTTPPARDQAWTVPQVAAFLRVCRREGVPSIGLAARIAYYGAQRPTDCRLAPWRSVEPGVLRIVQSKTGSVALIPLNEYPALKVALRAARRRLAPAEPHPDLPIVLREGTNEAWPENAFQKEARRLMKLAGIPDDIQFRDLRATATTELQDADADTTMTQTHTGHKTQKMVRRYTRKRVRQAENAAKLRMAARRKG